MKQLSKIMLAAVASVALAAPAFAWDFSASGSALGKFNITNTTAATGANTVTSGGAASEGSSLKLVTGQHPEAFPITGIALVVLLQIMVVVLQLQQHLVVWDKPVKMLPMLLLLMEQ
jgi:hypothetical protein